MYLTHSLHTLQTPTTLSQSLTSPNTEEEGATTDVMVTPEAEDTPPEAGGSINKAPLQITLKETLQPDLPVRSVVAMAITP